MNEKLRQARIDRRWTVDYAARRIGIGRTTYLRWEQGTQCPHDSSLMLVCKAFDLSPDKLGFEPETALSSDQKPPAEPVSSQAGEHSWQPDPHDPLMASRLTAWSFLLQEETLASTSHMLYAMLECEIMTMVLQWKQSSNTIAVLQQFVYEAIRKHDAMHDQRDQKKRITRRHALQTIAFFPIQMYDLSSVTAGTFKTVPEDFLPLCAAGLIACQELRQYEHEGMQTISNILSAYLPTLEHFAQQSSPSQQTAAHLTAQGYLLVSILADHYGKLDQMEAACRVAKFYGQLARDPNLTASALGRLAVKFGLERHYLKALDSYQEALDLTEFDRVSPLLQGRIYAGLAGTYARCQQGSQALPFLHRAREVYPAHPEKDPSYPFAYSDENTLALWEGLTLKNTKRYTEATTAFLRFGNLSPQPGLLESHRAEHLNYVASVAVEQRDLEAASLYLNTSEEVAWFIKNEQRQAEVRDTLRSMQLLWPDEPKVKQLQEKMYERQR